MIYFLTRRTDHDPYIYKSSKITVLSSSNKLEEIMLNNVLGFDTEGSGKRYYVAETLLIQLGTKDDQIVIDFTEPDNLKGWRQGVVKKFNSLVRPEHIFIGHNLKYDQNMLTPYGFILPSFYDTMIAEQRINLGSGLLNNLKDTYERHLKRFFPEDKEIRKEFVGMSKNSRFLVKHIMYAAGDTGANKEIAEAQKQMLATTKQTWFVRNVEFPLVKVLSEIELEGLDLNKGTWKGLLNNKKKEKLQYEIDMDTEIRTLGKGNMYLTGGKFARERKRATVVQGNMFNDDVIETDNINKHNINYNSRDDIFDVMDALKLPIPTFTFTSTENGKPVTKRSLKEEALMTYLLENPTTPFKSFFNKLLKYKGVQKFISSYGDKFLQTMVRKGSQYEFGFVNPVTKRVHTVLKQCFTDTGRLSSGDADEGVFNIQNLPKEKEVRQAFELSQADKDAGYWFTTCDLSGAELIIMAAFANDTHLYELGADKIVDGVKIEADLHSPISTKCWRAVYQYRLANGQDMTIHDSYGKAYTLTADFEVSKTSNKQLRTDFKPMVFGVFYGMMAKKGGETLNISKEDAQVIIDVIRKEFPKTIKMLERAVRQAFRHGYVLFNERSYNRRLFKPVLDVLATISPDKYDDDTVISYVKEKLSFATQVEITGAALNCRIQGTQADMIKESLVEIRKHPDYEKCKAKLLLSVHDENGAKHIGKEFGETMKQIMIAVANKYLESYSATIRMGADAQTLHSWTK